MVAKYIPGVIAIGVILVAWRLMGGAAYIEGLTKKELQEQYDFIIGMTLVHIYFLD